MSVTGHSAESFQNHDYSIEIDYNLYTIIIEWIRNGKRYNDRESLVQAILNEYEDRHLRSNHCPSCSRIMSNAQPQPNPIFKPTISIERRYTSRQVYTELNFIYDTNRYNVRNLVTPTCDCCSCHDTAGVCPGCPGHPPGCPPFVSVEDYIKTLIKTNYEQAMIGINKSSILMTLPPYINRQEFETKIKTICDVDTMTYKLKQDLEIY